MGKKNSNLSHESRKNTGKSLVRATPHKDVAMPSTKMQGTGSQLKPNPYKAPAKPSGG